MADGVVTVRIEGLKELRAKLRVLGGNTPAMVRNTGQRVGDLVIRVAKPRVPLGPSRNGHAADTMRVDPGVTTTVSAGDAAHSYYPWLDFGGAVGIRNSVRRPYIKTGRYIYPAYRQVLPQIKQVMEDELRDAANNAGLRTH